LSQHNRQTSRKEIQMTTKDLIPLKKGSQRAKDLGRMGGLRKSPRKRIANIIKGYKYNTDLTDRQLVYINLLENQDFYGVFTELVKEILAKSTTRDELVSTAHLLAKILPQKSINIDIAMDYKGDLEWAKRQLLLETEKKHLISEHQ